MTYRKAFFAFDLSLAVSKDRIHRPLGRVCFHGGHVVGYLHKNKINFPKENRSIVSLPNMAAVNTLNF